jgi:hypothetical protein
MILCFTSFFVIVSSFLRLLSRRTAYSKPIRRAILSRIISGQKSTGQRWLHLHFASRVETTGPG